MMVNRHQCVDIQYLLPSTQQQHAAGSASESGINAAWQGTKSGAAGLSCRCNYDMDSTRNGERLVQIFVDADACPVVGIVEEIAEKYNISTTLLCDTNHMLYSDYSEVIVVGAGADAVDYKLISICHKGDVVVSQDYGVAAMALGKGAYAIHQSGKWYTNENIDQMLMERHLNKKARRCSHKHHMKGPRKRTEEDDVRFAQSFEKLILMAKSKEGAQSGTI